MTSQTSLAASTGPVRTCLLVRLRRHWATALLAVVTSTVSCGGGEGPTGVPLTLAPVLTTVTVSPSSPTMFVGGTAQFSATAFDAGGAPVSGTSVTWSVSDTLVASLSGSTLTGRKAGSATLTATATAGARTVQGSAQVTVVPVPVASIVVSPPSATLRTGETATFTAVTRDSAGGVLDGRTVTWSTGDTAVATVSVAGVVTGKKAGTVAITATSEGRIAAGAVTVLGGPVGSVTVSPGTATIAVGTTTTLSATTRDSAGATLAGRVVSWSSANSAVATVNAASGVVTGIGIGTATITATSEGRTGAATVTVTSSTAGPTRLASGVTLSPLSGPTGSTRYYVITVPAGAAALTITTANGTGDIDLYVRRDAMPSPAAWDCKSDGPTNAEGCVLSAPAAGEWYVLLNGFSEYAGASLTATVIVPTSSAPVATVTIVPATASVPAGQASQFTATTRDSAGTIVAGRVIVWSSSDTTRATAGAGGLVIARQPGVVTITATSEGRIGTATITVTPAIALVASVTVSPAAVSVLAGQVTQLAAAVKDSAGATLTGRSVTWTSSDTAVASVNGSGLVTGKRAGTVMIAATSEGRIGTATVTVNAASLTVSSLRFVIIDSGTTHTPTFVLRDPAGTVIANPQLTFESRASAATVGTSGIVAGRQRGQALVVARSVAYPEAADSILVVVAAPGGPVLHADFPRFEYTVDDTVVTVRLILDMRTSGLSLGSANLAVTWSSTIMRLTADQAGASTVSSIANASGAPAGIYKLAVASGAGVTGRIELRTLTFSIPPAARGRAGVFTVAAVEANAAGTLQSFLPSIVSVSHPFTVR